MVDTDDTPEPDDARSGELDADDGEDSPEDLPAEPAKPPFEHFGEGLDEAPTLLDIGPIPAPDPRKSRVEHGDDPRSNGG